jgi:hypothetical protein
MSFLQINPHCCCVLNRQPLGSYSISRQVTSGHLPWITSACAFQHYSLYITLYSPFSLQYSSTIIRLCRVEQINCLFLQSALVMLMKPVTSYPPRNDNIVCLVPEWEICLPIYILKLKTWSPKWTRYVDSYQ